MVKNMELKELLFKELNVKESFEIPTALLDKLLGTDKDNFLQKVYDIYDFEQDSLRDLFQSEQSNRKDLMQDYTPDCICQIFQRIVKNTDNILDICSGTGALTISSIKDNDIKYLQCEELSSAAIPYLLLNLSLRNISGEILQKNVITREVLCSYTLEKGAKFSSIEKTVYKDESKKFDAIISNPPYSLSYTPDTEDTRIKRYEAPPKSKADYLFILDALERLSDDGKAFFILPHGVLFRGQAEGRIRQKLIENNLLEAVIGLPEKLFMNTSIPVCIMVLNKNKKDNNVFFVNGDRTFTKLRKNNTFTPEQVQQYVDAYNDKKEIEGFSKIVSFDEIKENNFNLNFPRYVQYIEPKEEVSLTDILNNLANIKNEIKATTVKLRNQVSELIVLDEDGNMDISQTQIYQMQMNQILDYLDFQETPMLNNINTFINCNNGDLSLWENRKLTDIVDIEMAKKGKLYPAGSIKIQMSATRGQMFYLETEQEVESHYGVMTVKVDDVIPLYLFNILEGQVEDFLKKYQTGLNITTDIFDFWEVKIHKKVGTQMAILQQLHQIDIALVYEQNKLDAAEKLKDFHLNALFAGLEMGDGLKLRCTNWIKSE